MSEPELNRRLDEIAGATSTRCVLARVQPLKLRDTLVEVTASPAVMRIALFAAASMPGARDMLDKRARWLEAARYFVDIGEVTTAQTALSRADEIPSDIQSQYGAELQRRADMIRLSLGERPNALDLQLGIDDIPVLVRGGFQARAAEVFAGQPNASTEDQFRAAYALGDRARMTELLAPAATSPSALYVVWLDIALRMRGDVDEAVRELIAHRRAYPDRQLVYDDAIARRFEVARSYDMVAAVAPLRIELGARQPLPAELATILLREALLARDAEAIAALRPLVKAVRYATDLDAILTRPLDEALAVVTAAQPQHRDFFLLALWGRHVTTGFGRSFEARFAKAACAKPGA